MKYAKTTPYPSASIECQHHNVEVDIVINDVNDSNENINIDNAGVENVINSAYDNNINYDIDVNESVLEKLQALEVTLRGFEGSKRLAISNDYVVYLGES